MSAQDGMVQGMRNMVLVVSLHLVKLKSPFGWQNPPCHAKLACLPLLCGMSPAICKFKPQTVEQRSFSTAVMVVQWQAHTQTADQGNIRCPDQDLQGNGCDWHCRHPLQRLRS